MHYDALVTSAIAAEWRRLLLGGRIDKIFQPDAWSLALLVRSLGQNRQVFLSLNPRFARAVLVDERKLASGFDEPAPFVMLLRKHLEGARISAVEQPPLERILHLETSHGGEPPRTLVVELLGRQSNAVLLDEQGVVLGVLRPVTAEMSRTRVILPHRAYAPPPPAVGGEGSRLDPRLATGEDLAAALAERPAGALADALPRVLALSPTAAREAVFRATGDARAADGDPAAIAAALRALTAPLDAPEAWTPTLAQRAGAVVAFAPYPLHHLAASAGVEAAPSMSLAVERYFAPKETQDKLESRRSRLRALVRAPLERAERRAASFAGQLAQAQEQLGLRHSGELLLAYQPAIAGQRTVTLDDYETGAPVTIAVDPNKDAVQNANELFRQYGRAKRALAALEPQQADAALEAAFGRQLLSDVALGETPGDLIRLEEEIRASGYLGERNQRGQKRPTKGKGPRKGERAPAAAAAAPSAIRLGGFEVLYGKTSQINDALTFRLAARQDLWLHAKGVPGAHVVVRSGGRPVSDDVLAGAASIAAYLSEARGEARAAVDYTPVANVRRQPGGKPGLVYYVGERTIQAAPRSPDDVAAREEVHAG